MLWIKSGIEILPSRRSLAVVAGMKKPNDHAEPTKVKRQNLIICFIYIHVVCVQMQYHSALATQKHAYFSVLY